MAEMDGEGRRKRLWKVATHLGDEYRRAYGAGQARGIVAAEYRRRGCRRECMRDWTVEAADDEVTP